MIFVTLGSQKFQFNRLLQAIDVLIESGKIKDDVFAQIGSSDFLPENFEYKAFLNRDEFSKIMSKCDIVITHGGTGTIIYAVKKGKKVIVVPRLSKYGEHVDDHQIELLKQFDAMGIIEPCYKVEELSDKINQVKNREYNSYQSNTTAIIKSIDSFISCMGHENK